jgi:hypothetical protein
LLYSDAVGRCLREILNSAIDLGLVELVHDGFVHAPLGLPDSAAGRDYLLVVSAADPGHPVTLILTEPNSFQYMGLYLVLAILKSPGWTAGLASYRLRPLLVESGSVLLRDLNCRRFGLVCSCAVLLSLGPALGLLLLSSLLLSPLLLGCSLG